MLQSEPLTQLAPDLTTLSTEQQTVLGADATRLTPAPKPSDDATVLSTAGASKTPTSRRRGSSETGPLAVGDRFGRYTIMKLLGIGGMGAVYQAWDQELEVVVALKVIRPEAISDPVAEQEIERRFKRELLLARQVTHKNVVRIHDLGEIDGIKYITMTFVDGTDLSTVLKREGRLPIARTLRIMRAVCSGLVAAHTAGVVHRDLKPANIMIDADGEALIMDFGIARSTAGPADVAGVPAAPAGAPTATGRYTADATAFGSIIGTVEYMAPEQARPGQAIDQRADIYTTGLILYDLLAGKRRADQPGNALDQLRARIEKPLPPIKSVAPDVSEALSAIVTRATQLDPDHRFQTIAEMLAALNRLDDKGVPLPIKRTVSMPLMIASIAAVVLLAVGGWLYTRPVPPEKHPPVSVVIADFENRTGDPTFDRTLEPMLRRALEGASFITAYDRTGISRTVGAALPAKLDEEAARALAVKQGLNVVLSGAIEKQGSGYSVSMKATETLTGKVDSNVKANASGQDQVLPTATRLISSVRKSLGDRTSESAQMFAMTSLSTSSLEVVKDYAAAMESLSNNQFDAAKASLTKAVELDPNFGIGFLALAGVARNQGKADEAMNYVNQALSHLDGMTERERYTARGTFYRMTSDYQQCVKEHTELITRYAADVVGHNQLALCLSQLRDLTRARDEMQAVVTLLPERAVFRDNLALYSNYAGDFATGEREARTVQQKIAERQQPPDAFAGLALAFAQLAQGQTADAKATYTALATAPGNGATFSASGLIDLAVYEGRFNDAVKLADQGAAANLAEKRAGLAAAKYAEQAYAHLLHGRKDAAVASAAKALATAASVKIRFLVGRIFVDAGQVDRAKPLMTALEAELQPEPQSYGKILEGMIASSAKDPRSAIKLMTDAGGLLDTWIAHFELGRAYLASGQLLQADSEFDRCLKRRGEALALFLDEEPTYGYFPIVYYYQGLVKEGLKSASFAEPFRTYLSLRGNAGEDPLIADIRRRLPK